MTYHWPLIKPRPEWIVDLRLLARVVYRSARETVMACNGSRDCGSLVHGEGCGGPLAESCIGAAKSPQVKQLLRVLQFGFSCPAPNASGGGCRG